VLPVAAPTGATVVLGALPLSPSPDAVLPLEERVALVLAALLPDGLVELLVLLVVVPGRAGLTVIASRELAPIALVDPFAFGVDGVTEADPVPDEEPEGIVSVRGCGERTTSAAADGSGTRAVASGAR
jgi:hypothetical protein